jgi:hypothetical protein
MGSHGRPAGRKTGKVDQFGRLFKIKQNGFIWNGKKIDDFFLIS